jgi:plasmid stability protein
MAQLVVRNLEEEVKARLQRRANRNGQSMEEEVRDILRNAVRAERDDSVPLGSRLRERFAGIGLTEDIPPLRGQRARAATFKKK